MGSHRARSLEGLAATTRKSLIAFTAKINKKVAGGTERHGTTETKEEEVEIEVPFEDIHYGTKKLREQFSHSAFRFKNYADHIFIALSLAVSFSNVIRFPFICSESGGVLFFIPYMLCITFITVPIMYLENALGQYSSLPPMQLFYHLCPAFGGIGFAMTFVAIFKSVLLSYSTLNLYYAFSSLYRVFQYSTSWLECIYDDNPSCYDLTVHCNETMGSYQYYSKCYDFPHWNNSLHLKYTWEQVVIGITSTTEAIREFPPNIFFVKKVHNPEDPNPYVIAAAIIEQAIIAVIAMLGMRVFAKIARFIVIFPQICLLIAFIYAIAKIGFRESFAAIAKGFSPNLQELLTVKAWTIALLHAIVATNLVDGSFITLAAMKDFRNNFMRDTFVVVVYGIIINIIACFATFTLSGAVRKLAYPYHEGFHLPLHWQNVEQIPYTAFPLLFGDSPFGGILLFACYFALYVFEIAPQIVALEMIVMTIYRAAVRTKYLDTQTFRNIIICMHFLLMHLYIYLYNQSTISIKKVRYFYFPYILSMLAFFELLVSIHIYRLKRFIANLRTMLGAPPNKLWKCLGYPVSLYWTACWYFITPTLCVVAGILGLFIATSSYRKFSTSTALITFFPLSAIILIMVVNIAKAFGRGKPVKSLFIADFRWAPELSADRQQALYEERATRALI